ncbi:MAG: vapC [Bryobacterales bacterium]|nr:vapC [Bryobacterales bacterium]
MKSCVDASALVAILLDEPDALDLASQILASEPRLMSPVNYWEALVRARVLKGTTGVAEIEALIRHLEIEVTPVSADHAKLAARAAERYGKPNKARLNLGDCFAYALAVSEDACLVYKGNDFPETDVTRCGNLSR